MPPDTIDDLRALLVEIMRDQSKVSLGKRSREALGRILDQQGSLDLLSITKLSERIGTSPSTITRLARSLGYDSFGDFQRVLLGPPAAGPGEFYLNKVRNALSDETSSTQQRAAQLCFENQSNINRFVEGFDTQTFDNAVRLIERAPRVSAFGMRQFHSLAAFLVYGLRLIRNDVSIFNSNALGAAEELSAMQRDDVLIVTSVFPYSCEVVQIAEAASDAGLSVIAFTDLLSSPLVNYSAATLFVPHESSYISNSITSYFAAAECLVNAVALASPEKTQEMLKAREASIVRMGIEQS